MEFVLFCAELVIVEGGGGGDGMELIMAMIGISEHAANAGR